MDNLRNSFGPVVGGHGFECHVRRIHSPAAGARAGGVTPEFHQRSEVSGLGFQFKLVYYPPLRAETRWGGKLLPSIHLVLNSFRETTKFGYHLALVPSCLQRNEIIRPVQMGF